MKNTIIKTEKKRNYMPPEIKVIKIDNEISLVMMSSNPGGDPDESIQKDYFNLNPFKMFKL
jgi:hypothetical protein